MKEQNIILAAIESRFGQKINYTLESTADNGIFTLALENGYSAFCNPETKEVLFVQDLELKKVESIQEKIELADKKMNEVDDRIEHLREVIHDRAETADLIDLTNWLIKMQKLTVEREGCRSEWATLNQLNSK